jgi:hypothetical protein
MSVNVAFNEPATAGREIATMLESSIMSEQTIDAVSRTADLEPLCSCGPDAMRDLIAWLACEGSDATVVGASPNNAAI